MKRIYLIIFTLILCSVCQAQFNKGSIKSKTSVIWATGGAVVLATAGNDTAPTSGPRWWTEVQIPYKVELTGINYLVGSVGGTDSVVVDLYNSAGTVVAL